MATEIKMVQLFDAGRYSIYAAWDVTVDGVTYDSVGAVIGVPDYQRGTAKAAGNDSPFVEAWFADPSDWEHLTHDERDAALGALSEKAVRIYYDMNETREAATTDEVVE